MSKSPESSSSHRRPGTAGRTPSERALRSMLKYTATHSLLLGIALGIAGLWIGPVRTTGDMVFFAIVVVVALLAIGRAHERVARLQRLQRRKDVPRPRELPILLTASVVLAGAQAFVVLFLDFGPSLPLFLLPLVCLTSSLLGTVILAMPWQRYRLVVALAPAVAVTLLLTGVWWVMAEQERQRTREGIARSLDEAPLPIAVLDSPGWEPSRVRIEDDLPAASIDYVPVDSSFAPDGFSLTLRVEPARPEEVTGWAPLYKGCPVEGGQAECEVHGDGEIVVAISEWGGELSSLQARVEVTDGMIATLTTNMPGDAEDDPDVEHPDIDMAELAERIRPAEPEDAEEIATAVTD